MGGRPRSINKAVSQQPLRARRWRRDRRGRKRRNPDHQCLTAQKRHNLPHNTTPQAIQAQWAQEGQPPHQTPATRPDQNATVAAPAYTRHPIERPQLTQQSAVQHTTHNRTSSPGWERKRPSSGNTLFRLSSQKLPMRHRHRHRGQVAKFVSPDWPLLHAPARRSPASAAAMHAQLGGSRLFGPSRHAMALVATSVDH